MSFIAIKSKKSEPTQNAPLFKPDLEIPLGELRISDEAAAHIRELKSKNEETDSILRVAVAGGGCAGLSYSYSFEKLARTTDIVFHNDNVSICVDPKSLKLLGGSLLHWQASMKRLGFQIINKQGHKSCSCGESFSV